MAQKPRGIPVQATARVTLSLEILADSSWGTDCSVGQVQNQAVEDVLGAIRRDRLGEMLRTGRAKIVGTPLVTSVLVAK